MLEGEDGSEDEIEENSICDEEGNKYSEFYEKCVEILLNLNETEPDESVLASIKKSLKLIFEQKTCKKMENLILDFFGENEEGDTEKPYKLPEGLEEDAENIKKLEEWIEREGGETFNLEVRFMSDVYRGVFLKKDMKVSTNPLHF